MIKLYFVRFKKDTAPSCGQNRRLLLFQAHLPTLLEAARVLRIRGLFKTDEDSIDEGDSEEEEEEEELTPFQGQEAFSIKREAPDDGDGEIVAQNKAKKVKKSHKATQAQQQVINVIITSL